ncbi:MAG: hypothetical protein M3Y03_00595 [Verrucomicrobiota bacterium]|nr:hypothetical protein [Verrucomicrobiota bacterium]
MAELIEKIKALPAAEQAQVREFVLNGEGEAPTEFLNRDEARALGGRIMEENEELFRRLAQ